MDVFEAIDSRRAVKHFDRGHRMPGEEIERLLRYTMLSPTAFNIQHWRFVLVQDQALREELRAVSWMQPQITDCSLLVLVCADLKAWANEPERYWRNAPPDVRGALVEAMREYYDGRDTAQRDEAMRSCGIAAQTLMLAAKGMGYDTCPMDLSDFDQVARLVRLPPHHAIGLFVAVGKATEAPWPRGGQLPYEQVVVHDRF